MKIVLIMSKFKTLEANLSENNHNQFLIQDIKGQYK